MRKPLCIDLYAGLGGWAEGFLSEGWDVVGFDIERHQYGEHRYPAQLVLQDVRTLHGSQFRNADCIVASPPCQKYSWMAMPWSLAKREVRWQEWERTSPFGDGLEKLNALFDAAFRIQREASAAAGRPIPLVVENVVGAQRWVGSASWHHGSYYLFGDVPAIMPHTVRSVMKEGVAHRNGSTNFHQGRYDGQKAPGVVAHQRDGASHTRHLTNRRESLEVPGINWNGHGQPGYRAKGFNVTAAQRYREEIKQGGSGATWFDGPISTMSSRSDSRKAASALIAKIPFDLASHVARYYYPR